MYKWQVNAIFNVFYDIYIIIITKTSFEKSLCS